MISTSTYPKSKTVGIRHCLVVYLLLPICFLEIGCDNWIKKQQKTRDALTQKLEANPNDPDAWNELIKGASDPYPGEAVHYLLVLGDLAALTAPQRKEQAIELLLSRLGDKEPAIRGEAANGLSRAASPETAGYLPRIISIIERGEDSDSTWFLIEAVGKHGNVAHPYVDSIGRYFLKYMNSPDSTNAAQISARCLSRIGGSEAIGYLQTGTGSLIQSTAAYCKKLLTSGHGGIEYEDKSVKDDSS